MAKFHELTWEHFSQKFIANISLGCSSVMVFIVTLCAMPANRRPTTCDTDKISH